VARLASRIRGVLPQGGELPVAEWQRRHRGMVAFLWLNVAGVVLYSLLADSYGAVHNLGHIVSLAPLALLANSSRLSRKLRSVVVSLGLMTSAALFVHMSNGLLETHFYFFVLVVGLTLYEEWTVFLVAVGYVLLHHGVMGMVDPHGVFNRPEEWASPWKWAAIHAAYVAMAGVAGIVAWRLNEDVRKRMRAAQRELAHISETDSLTGLGNRRKLMADLKAGLEGPEEVVLVMLDLDGFKAYNDSFGHGAGDALLARLGGRLADNLGAHGTAYRPGGDEFCVIAPASADTTDSLEALSVNALYERGELFTITASSGAALLPHETTSVSEALRVADQRMYAHKTSGRPAPAGQAKDVLLQTLTERSPDLGRHTTDVAAMTVAVGRGMGLAEEELEAVGHAAELHDIGKMAIPDAILDKPDALTEEEWAFMRRHTLIGQRIVSAAPSLTRAGELIRSSHEAFDGTGYPDQLAGEDIPIGARIIAVCDTYEAIVSHRPYRRGRSEDQALAEIHRCSGTQFDPVVVAAFCESFAREGLTPA
jgi:diguanylate cyclase (GGDEF)-like protein